jgi:hypothetical protein
MGTNQSKRSKESELRKDIILQRYASMLEKEFVSFLYVKIELFNSLIQLARRIFSDRYYHQR